MAKPDQLLKRRGKLGLVKVDASWREAQDWLGEQMGRELTVDRATGKLNNFIVEPFVAHKTDEEFYVRWVWHGGPLSELLPLILWTENS